MEVQKISVLQIRVSDKNPRTNIKDEEIIELAANIKVQGLIQPITVRLIEHDIPVNNTKTKEVKLCDIYEVVCGARRLKAMQYLSKCNNDTDDFDTIDCIVKEMTDQEAFYAMVTENMQRQDITPLEESDALMAIKKNGSSNEDLAAMFGKSRKFISDRIQLYSLIAELKQCLREDKLNLRCAMMLSKASIEIQQEFYDKYKDFEKFGFMYEQNRIKDFILSSMMNLNNAPFLDNDDDDDLYKEEWNKGEFDKCKNCPCNTCSAKSLFDFCDDDARCTNADCFNRKKQAFFLNEIERLGNKLVKKGSKVIEPDETLIIFGTSNGGFHEEEKNALKEFCINRGYMVASKDMVGERCYYDEDDERLQELIKKGKVYRCVLISGYYGVEVSVDFYYKKADDEGEDDELNIEGKKNDLRGKITCVENSANENLVKKYNELFKLYNQKGEVTHDEEIAFWSLVVMRCYSSEEMKFFGISKTDINSIYEFVEKTIVEYKDSWMRRFIASDFLGASFVYLGTGTKIDLLDKTVRQMFAEKSKEIDDEIDDFVVKKTAKYREELLGLE